MPTLVIITKCLYQEKTGNSEILIHAIIYDTHVLAFSKYRHLVIITGTICYSSKVGTKEIEIYIFLVKI